MANSFTIEAFALLGVGLSAIGIRTYARCSTVGLRGLKPDDILMLGAAVVYSLETAAAYIVGAWWHGLANNGMTDEQRRTLEPDSEEWHLRIGGSKTQLVGWSLYTLLLWLLKFCMCIFYARLTYSFAYLPKGIPTDEHAGIREGVNDMRGRVHIGYGILLATYLAVELSVLLGCPSFHKNWQIFPDPGNHCQPAISKIDLYVTVVLNVVTDMYLMSIPLPMLWHASLPFQRKALLACMFCGGIFVMACGILRCVLILRDPVGGAQQAGSWAVRETFVAVIIGNIPMIYPFFRRSVRNIMESGTFRSFTTSQKNSRANNEGEFPAHSGTGGSSGLGPSNFNKKKFSGGRTLYPLSTMGGGTVSGSAERIVGMDQMAGQTDNGSQSGDSGKAGITVVTETVVQDRERRDGEFSRQPNHWPWGSQDA